MIEHLDERFLNTQFVVKCSNITEYEYLKLNYQDKTSWFDDISGVTHTIGHVHTQPIILIFLWSIINGKRILFYMCVSSIADQSLIDDWFKENCRPRYMNGQKLAYCDTINFSVCLNFCNDIVFEKDTNVGDIIELDDNRRFLILPDRTQLFLGHKNISNNPINLIRDQTQNTCKIISHIELTYETSDK